MAIPTRRKILFCTQISSSSTGFANVYYELISRLYKDDRFRIAEHASEGLINGENNERIKWRLYPNHVMPNDPRHNELTSSKSNVFGRWRFNDVLLDFEPDIVVDLRDPPCFSHQRTSPLRPYYHWCIGPTLDSEPQPNDWIEMFLNADSVVPYSQYGYELLNSINSSIKSYPRLGPGVDTNLFKVSPQAASRKVLELRQDIKLLGYVSKNQKRKRFPELIETFARVLKETDRDDVFLHLHTACPDEGGWDIPAILVENNVLHNVLFTYRCKSCGNIRLRPWQGACTTCDNCEHFAMSTASSSNSLSTDQMSILFSCYDLYIQYSSCEGLGIGLLEAAASGVPIMAPNYSAMETLIKDLEGTPIDYQLIREPGVDAKRAVINQDHAVEKIKELLSLPTLLLKEKGYRSHLLCNEHYSWDDIAERWRDFLLGIKLTGLQGKWGDPIPEDAEPPQDQVDQLLKDIGRYDLRDSSLANSLRELILGEEGGLYGPARGSQRAASILKVLAAEKDYCQNILDGETLLEPADFIEYADLKEIVGIIDNE